MRPKIPDAIPSDFARTAASPCVRKHGDMLRASTKKDVHWIIAHLFYQVSGAFEKTKRTLLERKKSVDLGRIYALM